MFKEIEAMMGEETLSVSLIVAKNKDGLSVTVLPKSKEGADQALSTPLALQGTAEELDAEFVGLLTGYSGARKSLSEQAADTAAVLEAAKAASAKKGQDALKKSATPAAGKGPKAPATQPCDAGGDDEDDDAALDSAASPSTSAPAPAASTPSLFAD